jgi:hypothetical protein
MFTRAAGVSPPWYRKTHLQRGAISGNWPRTTGQCLRPPLWLRVRWNRDESGLRCHASPHGDGWLTPAAPGVRCRSEEITTFAVHKRMFSRAAGVSPPWVGPLAGRFDLRSANNRTRSGGRAVVPNSAPAKRFSGTDGIRHAPRASVPRGAYAPRSWLRVRWNRDESGLRYRDASPHGRGWLMAPGARCRSGEEITTFTPAAPGARSANRSGLNGSK